MFARTIFVLSVFIAGAMAAYTCPPPLINNCDYSKAIDKTSATEIVSMFDYPYYEPPCIKINMGQTVSFVGYFEDHPLEGGEANATTAVPAGEGPFFPTVSSGFMWNITFNEEGAFPFYCQIESHYTNGMMGVVFVGAGCVAPPVDAPVAPPVAPMAPVAGPTAAPVAAPIKKSDAAKTLISAAGFIAAAALL